MKRILHTILLLGISQGCGTSATDSGKGADSAAAGSQQPAATHERFWRGNQGCYVYKGFNNNPNARLIAVLTERQGKPFFRLAYEAPGYYMKAVLEVTRLYMGTQSGEAAIIKPDRLVRYRNSESGWWPFPSGAYAFAFEGEGSRRELVLTMGGKAYRFAYKGLHRFNQFQGNYVAMAGASRAERLFFHLSPVAEADTAILGLQDYDNRFSEISLTFLSPDKQKVIARMKNFIYSPGSTTHTEAKQYEAKFVPSRSGQAGWDLLVDFGEGREVRYGLEVR